MFCSDIPAPIYLIFSNSVPHLLYYSHIPAALVSLLLGFFVFFKNRESLSARLLLAVAILFSLWSFLDVIIWTNIDSRIIISAWSYIVIINILLFIACVYFVYVFIDKKDVSLKLKIFWIALLIPRIIFNLKGAIGFDLANCEAVESNFYSNYVFGIDVFLFIWSLVLLILRYRKADKEIKKTILYLGIGIIFFLFSFFITGYVANYFDNFQFEQYGLFSMTVFMGFLAYLIVKYKAFDIKLIGAQALVYTLNILIASQFFFIQNFTNKILTGITLVLSAGFGWFLIQSVKSEVKRKEELQMVTDKLAVANDNLRKLDNAKSEFISIASHQLRTPLTAIKGYVSLLLEGSYGKLSQDQKDALNKTYQSNDRLIALVEDLLNLSRIESGRMEYNFQKINMDEVCREIINTFVIRAKDKGLSLEYKNLSKKTPEAMTDRNKVREVVSNLVDNALKYTDKGGVKVDVSDAKEGFIRVSVKDTGIGVPDEELPYLFSKFSRGKDTARLNAAGTGLGLHVGKRMMEDLKGKIWVESEGSGKGSTFIIEVPVEMAEEKE